MSLYTLCALVCAFVVSTSLGWALGKTLLPAPLSPRLIWALAPCIGIGISSIVFFFFRRPMFGIEFAAVIGVGIVVWQRRSYSNSPRDWPQPSTLLLILCVGLGLAAAGLMIQADRIPHGGTDGWAIWNMHARFLFRDGSNWQRDLSYTFHADYPLLVPSATARVWRYIGQEAPETGSIIGMTFGLSGVAVLAAVLLELTEVHIAMLMALTLLATPIYLGYTVSQYADVPLSFFILSTIGLICLSAERVRDQKRILILAGFCAGCAGWTKNEGLLFIIAACAALLIPTIFHRSNLSQRFLPFLAGLLPPLTAILFFKLRIAPPNEEIHSLTYAAAMHRTLDLNRYAFILKYFIHEFWSFGAWSITPLIPLFLYVVCVGINRRILRSSGWLTCASIFGIVLTGYFFVYVNTPIDLKDHLDSSFDRLLIHLWPSFLLLLGLLTQPTLDQ